ncbi:MAG: hypothetical protein ACTH3E_02080, partial [Psychroflexus halocasei]
KPIQHKTRIERKAATKFSKQLLNDVFGVFQFSIYNSSYSLDQKNIAKEKSQPRKLQINNYG